MKIKSLFYLLLFFFILKKGFVQQKNIKIPLIIDADTANEIDDFFAIVRAVGEPRFNLLGITAAQFNTSPYASKNSALESQKMNQELISLLPKYKIPLKLGSSKPLNVNTEAQPSDASRFIVTQAKMLAKGTKLHVVILGSCTNVASALLESPEIVSKLKVYYVGFWHNPENNTYNKIEFNTANDILATNFLLNHKGLDFIVMSASTSQNLVFDKEHTFKHLKNIGLGKYLRKRWNSYKRWWTLKDPNKKRWIMWDLAIIEALANPEFTVIKVFKTPKENHQRDIKIYTAIDTLQMEKDFWRHYKILTN